MGHDCSLCGAATEHHHSRIDYGVRTGGALRIGEIGDHMPKQGRPRAKVTLDGCMHQPLFYSMSHPQKGDTVLCFRCNKPRDVTEVEILSVRVVCWTCRMARTFGTTLLDARKFGARHSKDKGHDVAVFDLYGECRERFTPKVVQLSLPEPVDNECEA